MMPHRLGKGARHQINALAMFFHSTAALLALGSSLRLGRDIVVSGNDQLQLCCRIGIASHLTVKKYVYSS
jgi:hypothetical protein